MSHPDPLVSRVVARARVMRRRQREELAEELAGHFEDLAEDVRAHGLRDEEEIGRVAARRFGDPDLVGRALCRVYRRDRVVTVAAACAGLALTSVILMWALVFVVQAWAVASLGFVPPQSMAPEHLDQEGLLLGALTLAYLGMFLCSRVASGGRQFQPIVITALAALPIIGGLALWRPGLAILVAIAIGAAAVVWSLECCRPPASLRLGVLVAFFWATGGLAHARMAAEAGAWLTVLPTCAAVALACHCTMALAHFFDRRLLMSRPV